MCLECNFHTRTPVYLWESRHGARPHLIGRQRPLLSAAEITDRGVARAHRRHVNLPKNNAEKYVNTQNYCQVMQ